MYLEPAHTLPGQPKLKYPVEEKESRAKVAPGDAGYHGYDYDGGVDLFAEPPPDGDYIVYGQAEDKIGNRVIVSSTLTIEEGGKPRADVAGGEIDWQGEVNRIVSVPLGQSLCFTATVENIGPVPIRTAGPWPGQSYKFSENYNTLAKHANDDRGINRPASGALASTSTRPAWISPSAGPSAAKKTRRRIIDGKPQYTCCRANGARSMAASSSTRSRRWAPIWWGGLIHEFVEVANNYIDRISVSVGAP